MVGARSGTNLGTGELIERLAGHRTLGAAPREQLAWLAAHGQLRGYPAGRTLIRTGEPISELYVVLSGRFSIHVQRGSSWRRVMEWRGGDIGGLLPYSRMKASPGESRTEEPTELLAIHGDQFPEMIRDCHEVTAILVHVMLDRARHFRSSDLHDEKLASLGRLAAGLAHELNNPASAAARSAEVLLERMPSIEAAFRALGAVRLSEAELTAFSELRSECLTGRAPMLSPLEQSEREDILGEWLERHGVDRTAAESLAETGLTVKALDGLAGALGREALGVVLEALAASCTTRRLTLDIERAASRVHELVAAVKGFTYMDQADVPKPVDVARGLSDTLTILRSKAKAKSVRLRADVPSDLPAVDGFGGELNQVWANLIANAIDAVADGGSVEVSARRNGHAITVRIVDDGPGIPADLRERIFEPFFTTKPAGDGVGLGLAIARRLIDQHQGELEIDSIPGRTEFRVILPAGGPAAAGG
jgi:signal transduction histidine kinase